MSGSLCRCVTVKTQSVDELQPKLNSSCILVYFIHFGRAGNTSTNCPLEDQDPL